MKGLWAVLLVGCAACAPLRTETVQTVRTERAADGTTTTTTTTKTTSNAAPVYTGPACYIDPWWGVTRCGYPAYSLVPLRGPALVIGVRVGGGHHHH